MTAPTGWPEPDTYGHTHPAEAPAACMLCDGHGFKTTRRPSDPHAGEPPHAEVVQPCPGCSPVTFARWQAGHLGCRSSRCEVCERILATDGARPEAAGGGRWLED